VFRQMQYKSSAGVPRRDQGKPPALARHLSVAKLP
jgi:hypothetical protein